MQELSYKKGDISPCVNTFTPGIKRDEVKKVETPAPVINVEEPQVDIAEPVLEEFVEAPVLVEETEEVVKPAKKKK